MLNIIILTLSRATSHYCTTRAPLERATSHYCTTGSRGLFTAYLDLLVLRFSVHCSSTASLYIFFFIITFIFLHMSLWLFAKPVFSYRVPVAMHRHAIDMLSDDEKTTSYEFEGYLRSGQVRRLLKKGSIASHCDYDIDCSA